MLRTRHLNTLRICAVLCAATAVVVLGFLHARGSAPLSPAMMEYIAMGGSLSDICGKGEADSSGEEECPVCRIADAALGAPRSTLIDTQIMTCAHRIVAPDGSIVPSAPCRAPPARGPPLVV